MRIQLGGETLARWTWRELLELAEANGQQVDHIHAMERVEGVIFITHMMIERADEAIYTDRHEWLSFDDSPAGFDSVSFDFA